jgi:hypothetical protein
MRVKHEHCETSLGCKSDTSGSCTFMPNNTPVHSDIIGATWLLDTDVVHHFVSGQNSARIVVLRHGYCKRVKIRISPFVRTYKLQASPTGLQPCVLKKLFQASVLQCFGWTIIFSPVPGIGAEDGEIGVSYTGTRAAEPTTGYCSVVAVSLIFGCSADQLSILVQKGLGSWMVETMQRAGV